MAGLVSTSRHLEQDPAQEEESGRPRQKTLLAIGAHYDDCIFGVPGILLQGVARGYRVVLLSLIGDYTTWKPVGKRSRQLLEGTSRICRDYGVQVKFLDNSSGRLLVSPQSRYSAAAAVAEIAPDLAFVLWPHDRYADHQAASELSSAALGLGSQILDPPASRSFRAPDRIYFYDNGPAHTVGFEPDTYVDITQEWDRVVEWLGRLMALARNQEYDPGSAGKAVQAKTILARYRGSACGVEYAEALTARSAYPQQIL